MTTDDMAKIEQAAQSCAHGFGPGEPTEAQHKAGNYKKGRAAFAGMPVVIEQPCYSTRSGVDKNGTRWSCMMHAHYGYLQGIPGADGDELDVFIGPHTDSDYVLIINQVIDGQFDEHKVMLGFQGRDQATGAYLRSYADDWQGLGTVVETTISAFKKWIAGGVPTRAAIPSDFKQVQGDQMQPVFWKGDTPVRTTLDRVLYELRKNSSEDDFHSPMTLDAVIEDCDGVLAMDSLVMPFGKIGVKMATVQKVMDRAGDQLSVTSLDISDPFMSAGSANIVALFTLSDGQTVTIYLHNPDSTPKKILPQDEVVSWKWLLNRTEVTIAVAPERGQDLNIREVARRIMALAEKNMTRFAEAQKKAEKNRQMIADAEAANTKLEQELEDAKSELAELQKRQAEHLKSLGGTPPEMSERLKDATTGTIPDTGMYVVLSHAQGYEGLGKEGYEGYHIPPTDDGQARYVAVSSMKDASDVVKSFIKRNGLGASNYTGGQVYRDGQEIGNISYNGRAWNGRGADAQEIDISPAAVMSDKVEASLLEAGWTKGDDGMLRTTLTDDGEELAVRVVVEGGEIRAHEGDAPGQLAFVSLPEEGGSVDGAVTELLGLLDDELQAKVERNSVELNGDELGEFSDDEDGKKARRVATKDYLESLRGQMVNVPALDADVEIRKRGIKKTMTMTGNPLKLKMLAGLKQLIATSRNPIEEKNHKVADKRSVELYYRLSNRVSIDGERHNVTVLIEKDVNGMLHYDLLLEAKTKTALDSASAVDAGRSLPDNYSGDEPAENDGTESDAGQVLDSVALDDAATGSVTGNMVLNLFIEGEAPEMVEVEPLNVSPAEAVTAEGYAKLVDAGVLDDYADTLDAVFSDRIYQVRARLFDLGWDKRSEPEVWPLIMGDASVNAEFERNSAGTNNVGVKYSLGDESIADDFTTGPDAIAERLHALAGFEEEAGPIDDGYQFANMTAEFRDWLVRVSDEVSSPFQTAKAMEEAAKEVGLSIEWGFFAGPALDAVAMDAADDEDYQYHGKVYRGSTLLGRIDMGGDGKAMVFVGKTGNRRPKTSLGNDFSYSAGDAPNMIKALAEQAGENPDPNGEPEHVAADLSEGQVYKAEALKYLQETYPNGEYVVQYTDNEGNEFTSIRKSQRAAKSYLSRLRNSGEAVSTSWQEAAKVSSLEAPEILSKLGVTVVDRDPPYLSDILTIGETYRVSGKIERHIGVQYDGRWRRLYVPFNGQQYTIEQVREMFEKGQIVQANYRDESELESLYAQYAKVSKEVADKVRAMMDATNFDLITTADAAREKDREVQEAWQELSKSIVEIYDEMHSGEFRSVNIPESMERNYFHSTFDYMRNDFRDLLREAVEKAMRSEAKSEVITKDSTPQEVHSYFLKKQGIAPEGRQVNAFADAYNNKDADAMGNLVAYSANKASRNAFEYLSGLVLGKDAQLVVDQWAGVTPEDRAREAEERKTNRLRESIINAFKNLPNVQMDGASITALEAVKAYVAKGYSKIDKSKDGIITYYHLVNDDGQFVTLKSKEFNELLRLAESAGGIMKALTLIGEETGSQEQVTVEESEPQEEVAVDDSLKAATDGVFQRFVDAGEGWGYEGEGISRDFGNSKVIILRDKNRLAATADGEMIAIEILPITGLDDDIDEAFNSLKDLIENQMREAGWVPQGPQQEQEPDQHEAIFQELERLGWQLKDGIALFDVKGGTSGGEFNPDGKRLVTASFNTEDERYMDLTFGETHIHDQRISSFGSAMQFAEAMHEKALEWGEATKVKSADPATPEISPETGVTNPDNDYLDDVIAGEFDLTDTAVIDEVEAIAGRVAGDSELEEKLNSAIAAIEQAMLNATDNL